jgi:hypothetical protein
MFLEQHFLDVTPESDWVERHRPFCPEYSRDSSSARSEKALNGQMTDPVKVSAPGGFYPRTKEDAAKIKTFEFLHDNGAAHHVEASLYETIAREVIGSTNPKLAPLQPTVPRYKDNEEPWTRAYDFLKNFLYLHGMALSLSTLCREFPELSELPLRETFSNLDRDKYFHELLAVNRVTFAEKVSTFKGSGPGR